MDQIYISEVHAPINITGYAGTEASRSVKLATEDNQWLVDISNAISESTGNPKYGASSVAREAIQFYRTFYPIRKILIQHRSLFLDIKKINAIISFFLKL